MKNIEEKETKAERRLDLQLNLAIEAAGSLWRGQYCLERQNVQMSFFKRKY